jgi:hypothetical protein
MAEMMQQLAFRGRQEAYPDLKVMADKWDEHVRDAYSRGHDVQLHLHTQWSDAVYENGDWRLGGSWSILNYSPRRGCAHGRRWKGNISNASLRAVDSNYNVTCFRASYLAVAPSPTLLNELAGQGIAIESSIVGGLRVDTDDVQFDYTTCDEDFQPFYPQMTDARRVSNKQEPIVCSPIFHFTGSRRSSARAIAVKLKDKLTAKRTDEFYTPLKSSADGHPCRPSSLKR